MQAREILDRQLFRSGTRMCPALGRRVTPARHVALECSPNRIDDRIPHRRGVAEPHLALAKVPVRKALTVDVTTIDPGATIRPDTPTSVAVLMPL